MYDAWKSRVTKDLAGTNIQVEQHLWHGTDAGSVQSICRNEFNRSFAGKNGMLHIRICIPCSRTFVTRLKFGCIRINATIIQCLECWMIN